MTRFHSSSCLNKTVLYSFYRLDVLHPLSFCGHPGWSYVLAIMKSVTVNVHIQIYFWGVKVWGNSSVVKCLPSSMRSWVWFPWPKNKTKNRHLFCMQLSLFWHTPRSGIAGYRALVLAYWRTSVFFFMTAVILSSKVFF
jgi:hypothetical protein